MHFELLENRRLLAGTASISGRVFADLNVNGKRDAAESGIAKVRVYLDGNNNRKLDSTEVNSQTDSLGQFKFSNLNAGNYIVRQIAPAGMFQTLPLHSYGIHVTLSAGQSMTNRLFGDAAMATNPWSNYGGDARHTGVSSVGSQDLNKLHWQTSVDLSPQFDGDELFIHYGSPLVTGANTIIVPVKTGATNGFRVEAHRGSDGKLLWKQSSDYLLPPHSWTPSFQPALTGTGRIYFPGPGGTVYYRDNADSSTGATGQITFYGMSQYLAHTSELKSKVFIDTPITADKGGNIYFGIQVTGSNSQNLKGGIVRISSSGDGKYISATAAAGNDAIINKVSQSAAPALSNDGSILYVSVNHTTTFGVGAPIQAHGFLLALDSTTLKTVGQVLLKDPLTTGPADIADISTASPTVGPDGDVYYGVLDDGFENHGRGWMLHFSGDLKTQKTTGSFGWDDTASIVPASMVPSYHGSSKYLLMTKYNDYASLGGTGVNELAILDPNATQVDPVNQIKVMKEVLTIEGVTPDSEFLSQFPNAVREWCINTAAIDPKTFSVLANSEDGRLYRWDLRTNTLTQKIVLTGGLGEAYTPTAIGADGTVYAINRSTLFAVGQ